MALSSAFCASGIPEFQCFWNEVTNLSDCNKIEDSFFSNPVQEY